MKLQRKTVNFFLSKINVDFFSNLVKIYKVFQPFYKLVSQHLIDYKFPRHLFVETTSFCNLQCKMCPRNSNPVKLGFMDPALFKKIIDEAKQYGQRSFSLHLFGEPLLDKEIINRIEYIKSVNQENSIILTTNGVLLNSDLSKKLVKYGLDKIAISIHSPDKKTYQEITGKDGLETVEKNIMSLIEIKKELKSNTPKIFLRLVKIKENRNQVEEFRKKWCKFPLKIEIRDGHNYGGKIEGMIKPKFKKRYPCYHLWFAPGVSWDGEISICCDDINREAVIGNANTSGISEVWQGEKIKEYRRLHLRGDFHEIPLCKNCNVWEIYPDIFFKWQKK